MDSIILDDECKDEEFRLMIHGFSLTLNWSVQLENDFKTLKVAWKLDKLVTAWKWVKKHVFWVVNSYPETMFNFDDSSFSETTNFRNL